MWYGAFSSGKEAEACEVDHSPPFIGKVKDAWSYASTPPPCLYGVVLTR